LGGGFKVVEHTADFGVKAWGENPRELLEEAAIGMASQMYDPKTVRSVQKIQIELESESIDELLFRWLKEILYLMEKEGFIFSQFQIETDNFTVKNPKLYSIKAFIYGEKKNTIRHDICKEIKAVTRHGFYVKKNGPWWEANMLFDV
jgi:SHS2 domain-containing protein